jgi:hypothetical protein
MGFLKSRWSSLHGLRISINETAHIHYASLWITSCIVLHTFAVRHEAGLDVSTNEFYLEGLQIAEEERVSGAAQRAAAEDRAVGNESERETLREVELLEGKLKQENLKKELFVYLY